jgi:hypothetical protein
VLVAAAATGGTVIGYWWGHEAAERASPEPAVRAPKVVPGPPPERAPWPPPEQIAREQLPAPQPAPNQDVPASKSERQRPDQS